MAVTDIVILVFLGICVFVGARNGIIRQLGGIAGIFLGIYLSYRFSSEVSSLISGWMKVSDTALKVMSFALITAAALVVMSIVGRIMESLFKAAAIGWLNRLMGIMLSLAAGIFIVGLVLYLLRYIDRNLFSIFGESGFADSSLAEPILSVVEKVFPYLKKVF